MTIGGFLWSIGRMIAQDTYKTIKEPLKEKTRQELNSQLDKL